MSNNEAGNVYWDHSVITYHVCARCISWLSKGDWRFLGKVGCRMVNPDGATTKALQPQMDNGTLKCGRCFVRSDDCCALPAGIELNLDQLYADLTTLEQGYRIEKRRNPAYVAPAPTGPDEDASAAAVPVPQPTVPRYLREQVPLSELDKREIVYRIRDACTPVAQELDKKYIPHHKHLALHNGAIEKKEDPASDRRPGKPNRDKKSIAARLGAQKRATEMAEQQELEEMLGEDTPRKKRRLGVAFIDPKKEKERRRQELAVEIGNLEAERESLRGNAKGRMTTRINALNKERDALKD